MVGKNTIRSGKNPTVVHVLTVTDAGVPILVMMVPKRRSRCNNAFSEVRVAQV